MTDEKLSDERLAQMREHIKRWLTPDVGSLDLKNDLIDALAEVERLRAALAQEQREHANCEQFHHEVSMAKNEAMAALMDAYVEMAQEGDFDAASDEMRARVRDLLNRSKPD